MSLAEERGLPADLDAERLILGSLLLDGDYSLIAAVIDPEDFSIEKHRRIFDRMGELHQRGEHIEYATLANELRRYGQLESIDGLTYIVSLADGFIPSLSTDSHIRIVKEKSTLRQTIFAAQKLIDRCVLQQGDSGELLADAGTFMRDLGERSAKRDEFKTYGRILEDCGGINSFGQQEIGIQTPFAALNREIVGFLPKDLIVLGARPSTGKSAWAQQIGDYVAERYGTVASFQLEQQEKRVLLRGIAKTSAEIDDGSALSVNEIRSGNLNPLQRRGLQASCRRLIDLPVQICSSARTSVAIHAALRKLAGRTAVKLVIIDHLHELRSTNRNEKRLDELRRMTSDVKFMAGEMNVPVLLLAQLNRGSEKESRKPRMDDLRECGDIEQIADVVLFLHSKEEIAAAGAKKQFTDVSLLIAKQRDGARFLEIPLAFFGKNFMFVEAAA